jgi:hypothetical protein
MSRVKIGKHWFPAGGGQNSVVQLVAPTDNKQGVILRTISLGNGGAGQAQVVIYADTHAPAAPGMAIRGKLPYITRRTASSLLDCSL